MASEPAPEETEKRARRTVRERTAGLRSRAEDARRSLTEQAEALRSRSPTARVAFAAYDHDRRHAGALLAGGLAYRLFLWMLPAALMLASAVGLVADLTSETPREVAERAGLTVGLTTAIAKAAAQSGKGSVVLFLLGVWLVVWTGMSVVKALRLLTVVAYQIRPTPLRQGVRASVTFAGVMLLLMATPLLMQPFYGGGFALDLLVWLAAAVAWTPLFAWGFSRLPHRGESSWVSFLPGAALLALGLNVLRIVTSVYFVGRIERTGDLYGAIGVAAVLMVWLFLMGRLVVAAITLNAARYGHEGAPLPER